MKYHFNARWYDAETARFVSEDPARDGVSWFAYVGNNPLKYIDPTGLIMTELESLIDPGEPSKYASGFRDNTNDSAISIKKARVNTNPKRQMLIDGDNGRKVKIEFPNADSGLGMGAVAEITIFEGSIAVEFISSDIDPQQGPQIFSIEGLYEAADLAAGTIIYSETGVLDYQGETNTLPTDQWNNPTLQDGWYGYRSSWHRINSEIETTASDPDITSVTLGLKYPALRLFDLNTGLETNMPAYYLRNGEKIPTSDYSNFNFHSSNHNIVGDISRRGSTGCFTCAFPQYAPFISNFPEGVEGRLGVYRYD